MDRWRAGQPADRLSVCLVWQKWGTLSKHFSAKMSFFHTNRLVGLVVKASASRAEDNNNNNNHIQRRYSRFFTSSSQRHELSPTRMLKWPRRNRMQITCNTSGAYHMQRVVLRATWCEGTAQLLSLTELKSHLFELYFVGWIIKPMKEGRKPEYPEKTPGDELQNPRFESRLWRGFSGSSHTSDFKIGTPVATLPGAWRYRVSAETGRPCVSILSLGEVESLIRSFYLSVAAH